MALALYVWSLFLSLALRVLVLCYGLGLVGLVLDPGLESQFLCNALSVVVLYHDTSVNYATTLLLSAIAVVDNVYLVSCLLYQTGKAICYGTTVMIGLRSIYPQVSTCVPATRAKRVLF